MQSDRRSFTLRSTGISDDHMQYIDLHPSLSQWMREINTRLTTLFTGESPALHAAGLAVVGSRGKRLRPVSLLLSCANFGEVTERALTFSVLVELIHTASLAHDDVIDEADSRRGMPSAPARWGNKFSILLGDFLFARVFELATTDGDRVPLQLLSSASTEMGRAVITECAGLDFDSTEADYLQVIYGKTASLFAAATAIGAHLGGATYAQREALGRLGGAFGMAFQLADDLLDLQGTDVDTGKPLGNDWAQRRVTLPLIQALRHAPPSIGDEIRALWRQDPFTTDHQRSLFYLVEAAGGFEYGWQKVKEYREEACGNLDDLPASHGRDALRHLCTDAFPLPIMPAAV